ncbi:MAG TPA: type IV pilus assembly protein PilM [Rugosimonospora sp.]|nr:type IV pilus assembly protein PilM [Rugosimonospora sp.]
MAGANPIGVDIGSVSIRAVETSRSKDGPTVSNFGQIPLPSGVVQAGVIHDDKAVSQALRQLWTNAKFRGRDVVLGVTNPQIVVREMSVAKLPPKELRKSLPFQVRDMLPLPVERSLLDFYALAGPDQEDTVRGLLIAAPKEPVLAAVQAVERAGLKVARVDLASFALLRALSYLDGTVEAIVDIGAQATSVIIHADGEPLIVRTVPRGGAEITEMIATRLGATFDEAEALKCRVGLNADEGPETADVVREAVRPLIGEIRNSLAYLTAGDRNTRVGRVALSGGGALLPGLVDAVGTQLGVSAVLPDPTMRLREPRRGRQHILDRFRSSVAVSIGLTLGAA